MELKDRRFEKGDWPIKFEVPVEQEQADRWPRYLAAACHRRGWASSALGQLGRAENSGTITLTANGKPQIDITWERKRGGPMKVQARIGPFISGSRAVLRRGRREKPLCHYRADLPSRYSAIRRTCMARRALAGRQNAPRTAICARRNGDSWSPACSCGRDFGVHRPVRCRESAPRVSSRSFSVPERRYEDGCSATEKW
jgi:hypothetical protein